MDLNQLSAMKNYTSARGATIPTPRAETAEKPAGKLFQSFVDTVRAGEEAATGSMIGKADPHLLVHALAQSELAVETAVTVRNKVVEAYQEILRMPV